MSFSRERGLGGRRGAAIPFETLSGRTSMPATSDRTNKKDIDDLFNRFGKILNVDLDSGNRNGNGGGGEASSAPPIPFVEFEGPPPPLRDPEEEASCSFNIYGNGKEGGHYRSSSVASVFGGYKRHKPILSPPKLTSVSNHHHHYQLMNYSSSFQCSNPYSPLMMGYSFNNGYSSAAASVYQQGFGLRNIYNSSPSNSQSSGFVSRGTTSMEGMNDQRDYRKCQFRFGYPQQLSSSSSGHHCHCCHCSCSRQSVASSSQQSVNSSNNFSKEMSTNSDNNVDAFSDDDDDDDENMDCKTDSGSAHSKQNVKRKSRIVKKGTIKTDSVTLESSSTFSSISNFILRIFIFLIVLSFFCIFFVGKWPEPLDEYVDRVHLTHHYLWDSVVPYLLLYFPTSDDISSAVFLYS